jgi:hypothetical protein
VNPKNTNILPTEIPIIFAISKIIQFKLLMGGSAGNYIKWENPKIG